MKVNMSRGQFNQIVNYTGGGGGGGGGFFLGADLPGGNLVKCRIVYVSSNRTGSALITCFIVTFSFPIF